MIGVAFVPSTVGVIVSSVLNFGQEALEFVEPRRHLGSRVIFARNSLVWFGSSALSIAVSRSLIDVKPDAVIWHQVPQVVKTRLPDVDSGLVEEIQEDGFSWPRLLRQPSLIDVRVNG